MESNIPTIRLMDNRAEANPIVDIGQLETNSVLVADAVWKSNPILFVA